jgi:UDP-N-acetylglucosamine 1-carboxyvinyltransferase
MSSKTITIHVRGGKALSGMVKIVPNKNAVLPAIAASILTDETMTYYNLPQSPDVLNMLCALEEMGAAVDKDTATVTICCADLQDMPVPLEYIKDMQAGYLFAGPLLARFGSASIPMASGCLLGYRGYEDHAEYLRKLGVKFEVKDRYVTFTLEESIKDPRVSVVDDSFENERFVTYQSPYVTPTENVLMLLSKTSRYVTEVSGIAQEPHVAQLIELLRQMGARIRGKGSTVTVTGVDKLRGSTFVAEPDHVDYFGFAVLAAMTKSDLLLQVPTPLTSGIKHINDFISEMGIQFEIQKDGVMVFGSTSTYRPVATFPKADKFIYKMNPGPFPGFPVDCLPSFIGFSSMNPDPHTATRSINWMYTDGLTYVPVLKVMGAQVGSIDDQRVLIQGVTGGNPYTAEATVTAPSVIEGVRAIISCALAGGKYTIKGVEYILRRNPKYFEILKELGADIEIESDSKKVVV